MYKTEGLPIFVPKKMRSFLVSIALIIGATSMYAQKNNKDMKNETTPLRLIYPQWQGGIIDHWMPDIPAEDSSRGYYFLTLTMRHPFHKSGINEGKSMIFTLI